MPTSAKAWRRAYREGVEIQFPSGLTAAIRPVSAETFIRLEIIPDTLTEYMQQVLIGTPGQAPNSITLTLTQYKDFMRMLGQLCETMFISPQVVAEGADEEKNQINAAEVDDGDKTFLFNLIGSPAKRLESFRPEQESGVESVGGEPERPARAKRDNADKRVGQRADGAA